MPEITLAKYAGFCFGVKHAVDTVEKLLNENPNARIYTLGKLIHNDFIVDGFAARGVKIIDEKDIDRIAEESDDGTHTYVVIRAHGVVKNTLEKLKHNASIHKNFHFENCTCPNVSKIHKIAEENTSDSTLFVMIGSPEHPEVKSIVSYAAGQVLIFENRLICFNVFRTKKVEGEREASDGER
jgi:4-hydroxy-3-methylbut-2-enyl diphosphate reductase